MAEHAKNSLPAVLGWGKAMHSWRRNVKNARCFNSFRSPGAANSWCFNWGSRDLVWIAAEQTWGTDSYAVSRAGATNFGMGERVSCAECLVDHDEGISNRSQAESPHIWMQVGVQFEDICDKLGIPKFRPA